MQKNSGNDNSLESTLALWQHTGSKQGYARKRGGILPLAVIFLIGSFVTVLSYFLYDPDTQTGNFMMTTAVFEDFMEDTPAVAVFLGLNDETSGETGNAEAEREKEEKIKEYIRKYHTGEK